MGPKRQDRHDTLCYMRALLGEMRSMAEAQQCELLGYLIEMALIEVSDIIRDERLLGVNINERYGAA